MKYTISAGIRRVILVIKQNLPLIIIKLESLSELIVCLQILPIILVYKLKWKSWY